MVARCLRPLWGAKKATPRGLGGKSFRNRPRMGPLSLTAVRSIASPKQGEGADCGGGFEDRLNKCPQRVGEEHRPCRSEGLAVGSHGAFSMS